MCHLIFQPIIWGIIWVIKIVQGGVLLTGTGVRLRVRVHLGNAGQVGVLHGGHWVSQCYQVRHRGSPPAARSGRWLHLFQSQRSKAAEMLVSSFRHLLQGLRHLCQHLLVPKDVLFQSVCLIVEHNQ